MMTVARKRLSQSKAIYSSRMVKGRLHFDMQKPLVTKKAARAAAKAAKAAAQHAVAPTPVTVAPAAGEVVPNRSKMH
jgi:hypothetical protein